jgi:hypothetical protein
VADVALVFEGVVFAEELLGAEVCGLEVSFLWVVSKMFMGWGFWNVAEGRENYLPHCVQYCHVQLIIEGSEN